MAARDAAVCADAQPDEHVAAEGLDQSEAFAHFASAWDFNLDRSFGQARQNLLDQSEALLDLANAHPDARVDVALVEHRHVEPQRIVRRITGRAARIDGPARGAADMTAGAELPRKLGLEDACGDGAVLQR